jgi:hypothetical protein
MYYKSNSTEDISYNIKSSEGAKKAVLRIRDVYPGSRILIFTHPGSRISDPGSKKSNKKRGEKKFVNIPCFVATNFTKMKIILRLNC